MHHLSNMPEPGPLKRRGKKKTECPITREHFRKHAQELLCQFGDAKVIGHVCVQKDGRIGFSTGSLGWRNGDKVVITIGDTPVTVQVNLNLTVVGSKELPYEEGEPQPEQVEEDIDDGEENG